MKTVIGFLIAMCFFKISFGGKYTGTYNFNKGVNKANATIYVNHFKEDSAFVFITAVSGMPEFHTLDFRGFITVYENVASYTFKNNCTIQFQFLANSLIISEDTLCRLQCQIATKYKKVSSAIQKNAIMGTEFVEKQGAFKNDSTIIYKIPLLESEIAYTSNKKETAVKIIDEYKQFYLIELKNKQNEFLWVLKKNIQLIK